VLAAFIASKTLWNPVKLMVVEFPRSGIEGRAAMIGSSKGLSAPTTKRTPRTERALEGRGVGNCA